MLATLSIFFLLKTWQYMRRMLGSAHLPNVPRYVANIRPNMFRRYCIQQYAIYWHHVSNTDDFCAGKQKNNYFLDGDDTIFPEYFRKQMYLKTNIKKGQRTKVLTGIISILLSQRESFVTVKIFKSKILMNFDVFEVPESE